MASDKIVEASNELADIYEKEFGHGSYECVISSEEKDRENIHVIVCRNKDLINAMTGAWSLMTYEDILELKKRVAVIDASKWK